MVVAAVDRIVGEVVQGVVHPPHVPLEPEAQAADVGRPRDSRPRRRLLGRGDDARLAGMQDLVELLEERDGLEVLATAVLVGDPLARLARVVQVQHRRDRVDPQAVGVVLLAARTGAEANRKLRTSLRPKLNTNVPHSGCSPRRGSSCSYSAVPSKRARAQSSRGKWAGTQSINHADTVLGASGRRRPSGRRGRRAGGSGAKYAGHLVAPGAGERMRHHGQQLDVGEAHVGGVGRQLVGELGRS